MHILLSRAAIAVSPRCANIDLAEREAMDSFVYTGLPARVLFGAGALDQLPAEVERLGLRRALVLSTRGQRPLADELARRLGPSAAGVFAQALMHVPGA